MHDLFGGQVSSALGQSFKTVWTELLPLVIDRGYANHPWLARFLHYL